MKKIPSHLGLKSLGVFSVCLCQDWSSVKPEEMKPIKMAVMMMTLAAKISSSSASIQPCWDKPSLWWGATQKRLQRQPPLSRGFLSRSSPRHRPSEKTLSIDHSAFVEVSLLTQRHFHPLQEGGGEREEESVSTVRCGPAPVRHSDRDVNLQSRQTHPAFREGDRSERHVPCEARSFILTITNLFLFRG